MPRREGGRRLSGAGTWVGAPSRSAGKPVEMNTRIIEQQEPPGCPGPSVFLQELSVSH